MLYELNEKLRKLRTRVGQINREIAEAPHETERLLGKLVARALHIGLLQPVSIESDLVEYRHGRALAATQVDNLRAVIESGMAHLNRSRADTLSAELALGARKAEILQDHMDDDAIMALDAKLETLCLKLTAAVAANGASLAKQAQERASFRSNLSLKRLYEARYGTDGYAPGHFLVSMRDFVVSVANNYGGRSARLAKADEDAAVTAQAISSFNADIDTARAARDGRVLELIETGCAAERAILEQVSASSEFVSSRYRSRCLRLEKLVAVAAGYDEWTNVSATLLIGKATAGRDPADIVEEIVPAAAAAKDDKTLALARDYVSSLSVAGRLTHERRTIETSISIVSGEIDDATRLRRVKEEDERRHSLLLLFHRH
jgi:hypothetical protein